MLAAPKTDVRVRRVLPKPRTVEEPKPICPRCQATMCKTYIELLDGSGWLVCFTCPCYDGDKPVEVRRGKRR
jgi:hypothetical protein